MIPPYFYAPWLIKKKVAVKLEVSPAISPFVEDDPGRVRQVLTNLIGNAIKFTEVGQVTIQLDLSNATTLRFAVSDTGIGIPPDKLKSIFEKFTQADTSVTRRFGGTGLGLAITKQLLALLGGDIGVESIEGRGSTFWFTLPYRPASQAALVAMEQETESKIICLGLKPISSSKALVVEDYPVNQVFAQKLLTKFGFANVTLAENGQEALHLLIESDYDVIFMDCQMPGLDGYETTARIRQSETVTGGRIAIIAMTANAMIGDREKCLKSGMDDYISKPLRPDRLRSILETWFSFDILPEEPTVQQSPTIEAPPVNLSQLRAFTDGDRKEEEALFTLFHEQATLSLNEMKSASINNDPETWRSWAHRLKGASANLGAEKLSQLAKRAEQGNRAESTDKEALLNQLWTELSNVEQYLASCHG
jgi:CheY-like chemotaxis protein